MRKSSAAALILGVFVGTSVLTWRACLADYDTCTTFLIACEDTAACCGNVGGAQGNRAPLPGESTSGFPTTGGLPNCGVKKKRILWYACSVPTTTPCGTPQHDGLCS